METLAQLSCVCRSRGLLIAAAISLSFAATPAGAQLLAPHRTAPGTLSAPATARPALPRTMPRGNLVRTNYAPARAADAQMLPPQIAAMPKVSAKLDVILNRSQLVVTRAKMTRWSIANHSVCDVVQFSPTEFSIIGLQLGTTTLTMWFEGAASPLVYLITVTEDPSYLNQLRINLGNLERRIALLFPNSKVFLIPMSRKIVVKGLAYDAREAAQILSIIRGEVINQLGDMSVQLTNVRAAGFPGFGPDDFSSSYIINMLQVPGEQTVMLRVRIAELKRSQLRRMGIDINYLINSGRHVASSIMGGTPSTIRAIFENGEIDVLINALRSNGTAKILQEPLLTTISGHPASFIAGGEFAVPTIVGVGGAQGTTTTFRGFGTSVLVTPTVIDRDLVQMNIIPEFSQLDAGNAVNGIPGTNVRRVQTTVKLREGQTIMLAGLISRQQSTEVTGIPGLSAIPKIGPLLFGAKRATEDETELLVLVTPEIVRGMDAQEVPPVPGFNVTHPDDHQLYHYGMTEGAPDNGVYRLAPYGRGNNVGVDIGYNVAEPAAVRPGPAPVPTRTFRGSGPAAELFGGQSRSGYQHGPVIRPHGQPGQPHPGQPHHQPHHKPHGSGHPHSHPKVRDIPPPAPPAGAKNPGVIIPHMPGTAPGHPGTRSEPPMPAPPAPGAAPAYPRNGAIIRPRRTYTMPASSSNPVRRTTPAYYQK